MLPGAHLGEGTTGRREEEGEQSSVRQKRSGHKTPAGLSNCRAPSQVHSVHRTSDKQVRHADGTAQSAWITGSKVPFLPPLPLAQGICTVPCGRPDSHQEAFLHTGAQNPGLWVRPYSSEKTT